MLRTNRGVNHVSIRQNTTANRSQNPSPFAKIAKRGYYEEALALLEGNKSEAVKNPLLPEFQKVGKYSTNDIISFMREHIGTPKDTVSKNPNVTVEQLQQQAKQIMSREVPGINQEYKKWLKSLGYTADEVDQLIHGTAPSFIEDNKLDWEAMSAYFANTDAEARTWKTVGDLWKNMAELQAKDDVSIDWNSIGKELGDECVQLNKGLLDETINQVEKIDAKALSTEFSKHLRPLIVQLKDKLAESIPEMEEMTDEIERFAQFPKDVENHMMHIDDFLDKYVPEVRYRMDKEFEEEKYDYEYKEEIKEFNVSIEELAYTKDKFKQLFTEAASAAGESSTVSLSVEDSKLRELKNQQERIKTLESDLQRLKSKDEDTQHHEEDSRKKKEEDPATLDMVAFGRDFLAETYPAFKDRLDKAKATQQSASQASKWV